MEERPPKHIIDQRIRNRIIEYLEMARSREALVAYQRNAPVNVLTELFNQWEDWVYLDTVNNIDAAYPSPTYTDEERTALLDYHRIWYEVSGQVPTGTKNIEEFMETPLWTRLSEAAAKSLAVFEKRGRLAEE